MKRPLAYITAAWCGEDYKNTEQAARYCRAVYEAGFSPICPTLYLPLFLNDTVPEEHNPLKTVELSTEQNYNMIDGLLNNAPALPPQPPEKELDKVKEPPNKHRSREREER